MPHIGRQEHPLLLAAGPKLVGSPELGFYSVQDPVDSTKDYVIISSKGEVLGEELQPRWSAVENIPF